MNKYILLGSLGFMGGCYVLDALIGSPDGSTPGLLPAAQKLLLSSDNPSYVLGSVGVGALVGLLKWIGWKRKFSEVVASTANGFRELTPEQLKAVKDAVSKRMPADVKKAVAAVKTVL